MADFNLDQTVALLERFPASLDALLRGLPDVWTANNAGGESWTPVEIVAHLIDSERQNWIPRAKIILEQGEAGVFPVFDRCGHEREAQGKTLDQLLDEFSRIRKETLAALRELHLKPADLEKRGRHPAFGTVTLTELLSTWAVHDMTHLHQLSRTLAYQYREAVGPWSAYLGVLKCSSHGG